MKTINLSNSIQIFCAITFAVLLHPASSHAQMQVGINLDRVADWGATQFPDVIKHQRDWMTRAADGLGDWDTDFGSLVPRNRNGWPTEIPFDPGNGEPPQIVHTVFPVRGAGDYRLIVTGKGKIDFIASDGLLDPNTASNKRVSFEFEGGRTALNLRIHDSEFGNGVGVIFLEYHESDPADPIRTMRLVSPGHLRTHWTKPFLPSYADRLGMFSNLRFMDWGSTNNSQLVSWSQRTRRGSHTQAGANGVALEFKIQLANQQKQDMWICIPAQADDLYVRNTARRIRNLLSNDLKVFVEYSNETWNGIFSQTSYVQEQGRSQGLSEDPWEAGQMFVAMRSAEIWDIFEDEFDAESSDRIVKIMASHAENVSLSQSRLEHLKDPALNPSGVRADAISIAPYFGGAVASDLVDEGVVDSVTPAEIVARAMDDMRNSTTEAVEAHRQIAEDNDLWLVLYEGGQHLVGSFDDFDNQTLTNKLIAANRHSGMYDIYFEYLTMLNDNNVTLFSNFSYVAKPANFGSWGILEDQDQRTSEAPKYEAITDWIVSNPASNVAPVARPGADVAVVDRDGDGVESIFLDGSESRDFDGRIVSHVWQIEGETVLEADSGAIQLDQGSHKITLTVTDDSGRSTSRDVRITIAPESATEVLVQSDFSGNSPSQNTPWNPSLQLGNKVSFWGWRLGAGLNAESLNDVFAFSGDLDGKPRTLAAAVSNAEYLTFTVKPTHNYQLDLRGAEFSFSVARYSYHAPRRFVVMSSVDGFAVGRELFVSAPIEAEGSPVDLTFSIPFDGFRTGSAVQFRIYPIDGKWSGHAASLNGFQLKGAATK